jgi:hypothetical protein
VKLSVEYYGGPSDGLNDMNQYVFYWNFLIVVLISMAFLQEYFLDLKKKYRAGTLKSIPLHAAIAVLGMAAAGWGLLGRNLYGERYVVIVVVIFYWLLFKTKKS